MYERGRNKERRGWEKKWKGNDREQKLEKKIQTNAIKGNSVSAIN